MAEKIVPHGGRIVMKVTAVVMARLHFNSLWEKRTYPPPISALSVIGF